MTDCERVNRELRAINAQITAHRDELGQALLDIVDCYHRESEDASDGEFALWKADDLVNAIIAGRKALYERSHP